MELSGGLNKITLIDGVLHRPGQPWSDQIQFLLAHLENRGFAGSPRPLGFDQSGDEMVSYLPGATLDAQTHEQFQTDKVLTSAASLLQRLHDASADYEALPESPWQAMPTGSNHQRDEHIICHNDFAPYNCVLNNGIIDGVFDFDTASPGPARWDIAYAVFRFCPLSPPSNPSSYGSLQEQRRRLHLFCDEYGTPCDEELLNLVVQRLYALISHMHDQAALGDEAFAGHIEAGHDKYYQDAIAYVQTNRRYFSLPN